jgi:uncharacterized membrane protein
MEKHATKASWIDCFRHICCGWKLVRGHIRNNDSQKRPESPWEVQTCHTLLAAAIVAYVMVLSVRLCNDYNCFAFHSYDLAIFDQATWLISHGQLPYVSVRDVFLLADHFSVILYLLAPIYRLCADARVLLIVQTICLALGALPIYMIAKFQIRTSWSALLFAVVYLCYPALHYTNLGEFHPETLAVPCLAGACYYLLKRKLREYLLLLLLASLTKETVSLTVLCIGIYSLAIDKRLGCGAITLGLLMYMIGMATITHFNAGSASPYYSLYSDYGNSIAQIMWNVMRHPWTFELKINTDVNRRYLFDLMYPLLFLPLLAPEIVFLALPAMMGNVLSYRIGMHTIYRHYTPLIIPFLLWAAIIGFERAVRNGNRLTVFIVIIYLILFVVSALNRSPIVTSRQLSVYLPLSAAQQIDQVLRLIPAEASVAADVELTCHLSHRHQVYMFPAPFYPVSVGPGVRALRQQSGQELPPFSAAEFAIRATNLHVAYVVLCPRDGAFPIQPKLYANLAINLLQSPAYGIISMDNYTILLRYGADHLAGLRLFAQRSGVPIINDNDLGRAFDEWHPATYAAY